MVIATIAIESLKKQTVKKDPNVNSAISIQNKIEYQFGCEIVSCNFDKTSKKVPDAKTKGTYHLSRCKNKCSCFWFSDPHNHSSKTLERFKSQTLALQTNDQLAGKHMEHGSYLLNY